MIFTAHDGRIYINGVHHTEPTVTGLLANLRRSEAAGGWWASRAKTFADQLEAAMAEAYHNLERAA